MIPHFALPWWLFGAAVIIAFWAFEASFRIVNRLRRRIEELENDRIPPLEIIFDPQNPAKRFWSMESPTDKDGRKLPGAFWEYRVEVKNNSSRTVRNVSVTTERIGQMAQRPSDHYFDKIKKTSCDLKPGCSELVSIIHWPIPIKQAGMLAAEMALEYGPVKVIASADDSMPSIRTFGFDYQAEPMLFE